MTGRRGDIRLRLCGVLSLLAALVAVGVGPAAAGTPLPGAPLGSGSESTNVAGLLAGRAFAARAAVVEQDFYGDLNVYLLAQPQRCGTISFGDGPFLWLSIDTNGAALPVGKAVPSGGGARIVANLVHGARTTLVRKDVSITFTRLDPRVGSFWRGTVQIGSASGNPSTRLSGSFAARWCGRA